MFLTRIVVCLVLVATRVAFAADIQAVAPSDPAVWTPPPPLSPADSLKTIEVPDGFTVELVAAEPLVMDPVAIAWGPEGKLWVVEMADYNHLPINDKSPAKPQGRVVYLMDTDGDGKYDKRTVFLDDLNYPTSVMPWRGGVLVTTAPDILYAEDTTPADGNGKADRREVLYTGFIEGNPQLRVNGLRWGLDGWIYCANGLSNGVVKSTKTGKTLDIRGRDLRIKPDTGDLDAASGPSQFGRVRDDYGNWFGVDNSRLIIHYVLEDHYLRRNPYVAAPEPYIDLVTPRNPPCYARGRKVDRLHAPYMANRFTSACGIEVYRDNLLGDDVYGQVFVCEPVHNLVTRRVLQAFNKLRSPSFSASRVVGEEQREFLASTDEWFRPVHVRTGPDGALWIVDMYRAVIEHPQWLPADFNKKVDWMQGNDRGRIYRVFLKGRVPRKPQRLDRLDDHGLVTALGERNGTVRDLAHMMLIWNHRLEATPAIRALLDSAGVTGLQAMAVLDGMGELEESDLEIALLWNEPRLAEAALAFYRGNKDGKPPFHLANVLDFSAYEGWGPIGLRLACAMGEYSHPTAGKVLMRIVDEFPSDRHILAAVLSSAGDHAGQLASATSQRGEIPAEFFDAIVATAVGGGKPQVVAQVLRAIHNRAENDGHRIAFRMSAALLTALESRQSSPAKLRVSMDDAGKRDVDALQRLSQSARRAIDEKRPERLEAVHLIGRGFDDPKEGAALLVRELGRPDSAEWHLAVLTALGRLAAAWSPQSLPADVWQRSSPAVRAALLDMLLRRDAWIPAIFDAIEQKKLPVHALSLPQRQALAQHKVQAIRQRAAKLLDETNPDRVKVLAAHQDVLTMKGDLDRGREHFEKSCAVCHRLAGEGKGYGPDLASLTDRSAASLLEAILDPNKAVDSRYVNYVAETDNGDTLVGIVLNETGNSVTMAGADGVKRTILRKDLTSLRATNLSIMPEGLEQGLGKQGLADVMAFVAHKIQPPRVLAGVKAAVIKPGSDGSLVLPATQCEAFGTTITYEKEDNNLGQWSNAEDYAAWTIEPREAGQYEVWFDYACDKAWKGNRSSFVVEAEGEEPVRVEGEVAVTGTLDDYRQAKVGVVTLDRKRCRVTVRAAGSVTGRLMDLRGIRLAPLK